jgi:hypothetical protein
MNRFEKKRLLEETVAALSVNSTWNKGEKPVEAAKRLEHQRYRIGLAVRQLQEKQQDIMNVLADVYLALRTERVRQAIGEKVRYMAAGNRLALRDGTLKSTSRKSGVVDFGELGLYTVPLEHLQPAKELK